jgi:hypothetical protein
VLEVVLAPMLLPLLQQLNDVLPLPLPLRFCARLPFTNITN